MATATATVFKKLPGVLAFQRGLVISDAELFNDIDGDYEAYPVYVVRHGIRGTQNVNKKGDGDTRQRAIIQQTDSAKLDRRADALIARFSVRFLDLATALFACAPSKTDTEQEVADLRASLTGFIDRAKQATGVDEIARRMARNIGNGRWLWRNRLIADAMTVTVSQEQGQGWVDLGRFEALELPLNTFGDYSAAEQAVAKVIAAGLRGQDTVALRVVARVEIGMHGAIEVFPSQNYIEDKPKGFARSLYRLGQPERGGKAEDGPRVMGRAAIRDQKVSNALRTIDTWYPTFAEYGRPIPVEPNGASLDAQRFFRNQKGASAFDLMLKLNQLDPASNEGLFVTACLIRGGVYSQGE